MRVLVIQCYQGNQIGEMSSEHVEDNGYFYYNFKKEALKVEKISKTQNASQDNIVFIVQYNKEDQKICRMLSAIYHKLKSDSKKSIDNLLKINEIKAIDVEYYEEIKKVTKIDQKFLSEHNHYLEYVTLPDDDYEVLTLAHKDQVFKRKSRSGSYPMGEEKQYDQETLDSYNELESRLCKLAQRSKYARRVIDQMSPRKNRTEFQRDWERIIHSKAFRRLEDKAQIYTLAKGDHFRTRLTHTMEVTQIARGLARELKLNEDLIEAISLGHDLGHTPFGHVGERTLHEIIQSNNKIIQVGGFKHNYQGVRVVNYLEERYGQFEGLDLTYQVMEGILKHTGTFKCENRDGCSDCTDKCYMIEEFLCKGDVERLYPNYRFSTTLEGQVVAFADEIAQRAHDLDDGMASGIINVYEFLKNLEKDNDYIELKERIDNSLEHIKEDEKDYIDVLDIKRARIVSDVITYFMGKLIVHTSEEMKKYIIEEKLELVNVDDFSELVIKRPVVGFDENTELVRGKLKKITSNKVINSEEVNCFDGKGEYIIKKIYSAYYTNPRQLPTTTLKRIYREILKYSNNVVDIRNGEMDLVKKEINIYKGLDVDNELKRLKYKIFIRSIVDLIAGMTDDFANKQFDKLYSPRTY